MIVNFSLEDSKFTTELLNVNPTQDWDHICVFIDMLNDAIKNKEVVNFGDVFRGIPSDAYIDTDKKKLTIKFKITFLDRTLEDEHEIGENYDYNIDLGKYNNITSSDSRKIIEFSSDIDNDYFVIIFKCQENL